MYGPYSSQEISSWKAQGFLTGPTSVLIRRVSSSATSPEGEWVSSDSIDFSSYTISLEKEEKGKESINNVQNQGKRKRAGDDDDDDDDGDDGDNEDDLDDDGALGGGGKRRRKGLRWDKDHDDEDD